MSDPIYYENNTTATIPKTAKKIDHSNYFMCMCSSLQRVHFESPSSLFKIGIHAFYKCSSLISIDLPPSISSIGMDAFSHCSALSSVQFPQSLMTIFPRAFHKCISLKTVWFPPSLVHIGKMAFFDCVSLVTATFSLSQTSEVVIGKDAFYGCSSLVLIVLPPPPLSSPSSSSFQGCDILQQAVVNSQYEVVEWLQQRFKDLPLHQICYSNSIGIRHYFDKNQNNIKNIYAVDRLGLSALHVLVCNPQVTADQIKALVEIDGCYSTLSPLVSKTVHGMTPTDLFLKCRIPAPTNTASAATSLRKVIVDNCDYYCDNNALGTSTRQQHCTFDKTEGKGGKMKLGRPYFSIYDAIERGMTWNEIECLLILDSRVVLDLDLKPSIGKVSPLTACSSTNPLLHAAATEKCTLDVIYQLTKYNINLLLDLYYNQ